MELHTSGLEEINMLQGGYFIQGSGGSSGGGIGGGNSNDIYVDSDGNIIYMPFDPIFIDEDNRVFLSQEERNGRIYMENNKLFVERLI